MNKTVPVLRHQSQNNIFLGHLKNAANIFCVYFAETQDHGGPRKRIPAHRHSEHLGLLLCFYQETVSWTCLLILAFTICNVTLRDMFPNLLSPSLDLRRKLARVIVFKKQHKENHSCYHYLSMKWSNVSFQCIIRIRFYVTSNTRKIRGRTF